MKRKLSIFIGWMILAGASADCSHQKVIYKAPPMAEGEGKVIAWAGWVKPKPDRYDISLNLRNGTKDDLIVLGDDLSCYRGEDEGELHSHIKQADVKQVIHLAPGKAKDLVLMCSFDGSGTGPYRVVVQRIFDNPTHDLKTPGKIVAKNVEWKEPETGKK